MKLKETIYDSCTECNRSKGIIQHESYGCDNCKKPIDELLSNRDPKNHHYLEVTVFREDSGTNSEHLQFCSWKCVIKKLPKIKCNYFITLPYLSFDNTLEKGIRGQAFLKLLKQLEVSD